MIKSKLWADIQNLSCTTTAPRDQKHLQQPQPESKVIDEFWESCKQHRKNTTCSVNRNLQNICCGYTACTVKSKHSPHIQYYYKIFFDSVKVYTYTHSNFPVSFTSFSQKSSPSMNKGRKEGGISSLQDCLSEGLLLCPG